MLGDGGVVNGGWEEVFWKRIVYIPAVWKFVELDSCKSWIEI